MEIRNPESIQDSQGTPIESGSIQPSSPYYQSPYPNEQPYQAQQGYQQGYQQNYQQGYQQPYQSPMGGYQQPAPVSTAMYPASGIPESKYKGFAALLYWTSILGILLGIFYLCTNDKEDEFMKHHVNQALALFFASIICSLLVFIFIGTFLLIAVFVFQIMATVKAVHGQIDPVPIVGNYKFIK